MRKMIGKRIGSLLLCGALLFGGISADTYAMTIPGDEIMLTEENDIMLTTQDACESAEGETISGNDFIQEERRDTVSAGDPTETQYHFVEEEPESVAKWLSLYCPGGFEDLLGRDEAWWNALYDYERDYADFLVGLIVEPVEGVYDEQDLAECIRVLESGVAAEVSFRGTMFEDMTLEDLRELRERGETLDDLAEREPAAAKGRKLRGITQVPQSASQTEGEITEELVARAKVSGSGYRGMSNIRVYNMWLGGVRALCIDCGLHCRSGYLYHADPGDYEIRTGHLAYFVQKANDSEADYVACQIAAWLFIEDENMNETMVKSRAQAIINISSKVSLDRMLPNIWKYYSEAKSYIGTYYEYHSDHDNAQRLILYKEAEAELRKTNKGSAGPGNPDVLTKEVTAEYRLEIEKKDWQTGAGLSGCEVEILENGEYLASVITDEDGCASYEVQKGTLLSAKEGLTEEEAWADLDRQAAEFAAASYTYSVREEFAPEGYVWDPIEKSETIEGGGTAKFCLTNERTLGAVELVKYDVEAEAGKAQGDASLDGAVYGIYAAEDIEHQDKKTGCILQKDALVQTAIIGRTPKRNEDGYLLNTDGSRHIAEPGKEIAYTDTPGKTLFGDLELGRYYIKEITPSQGYMLDEAVYPVTFTYKEQVVKIETREETANQAQNELTADDDRVTEIVYSGDYVNKQGVRFLKTSDNTWQTELRPIPGAGFCVYLIRDLSGVKSGQITPLGDSWTADDILTFYDYDFTKEKTATIYKRTGHESWTEGDTLWLRAGEGPGEYTVGEMFTDEDGYIETPELPYGTYVVVETTTPKHHTCAKPFIVSVTEDGGVLYTDKRKIEIEKSYQKEEGIRYGDHRETKEREGRVPQKQRIVNNRITKTHLRILKMDQEIKDMTGTYIKAEEFVRGTVLKEGAEYRLKCTTLPLSRDSLLALNWKLDGDGYLSFYDQNTREVDGTPERPFATRFLRKDGVIQDCYIMLPQEIPVGTYELLEVTAPKGYVVNGKEQSVVDSSDGRVNGYEIMDTPLPNMTFTIDNGSVYPDGQMGTNKYALTDNYGNLTVTVLHKNQEQKGILEITKHGEQLAGAKKEDVTLSDKLRGEPFSQIKNGPESGACDLNFIYEDGPVEGAVFQVIAMEDIYTQELERELLDSYQVKREPYRVWKEGEVAATITTDRNGFGYAANLYIGKYKIVETTAGDGFVLNKKEVEFEITGKEQSVNFDFHTADYKNERQRLEIAVKKQDQETGEGLAGAVFGLYSKEDIPVNIEKGENGRWVAKDTPEILCPGDTLVATCITDENGDGVFDEDLPLGNYYVRELQAPAGYLVAAEDVEIDASYDSAEGGQNTAKQVHERTLKNKKTLTHITKQDLADKGEVAGATLEIREILTDEAGNLRKDRDGNFVVKPVMSWVSAEGEQHCFYTDAWGCLVEVESEKEIPEGKEKIIKNGHLITGLALDKVYILSERLAPDGYGYAEDILFKLTQEKEDGKLTGTAGVYVMEGDAWHRAAEDILVMYDEREALNIEKHTIRMTQRGDTYRYTVDELKNLTGEELEEFTMTDHLPKELYLTELWTGTYSENLLYDAEYMTNQSGDWVSWEKGLSTEKNHHLEIPKELQTEEEHVTKFRLLFGAVGGDFEKIESPTYMTYVSPEAEETLLNEIELTAVHNGRKLRDKDETKTVLYLREISGYRAGGGGKPLYEIVDGPISQIPDRSRTVVRRSTEQSATEGLDRLEEEDVPLGVYRRTGVQTGDDMPILFLAQTAIAAFIGVVILLFFGRKKRRKKCGKTKGNMGTD